MGQIKSEQKFSIGTHVRLREGSDGVIVNAKYIFIPNKEGWQYSASTSESRIVNVWDDEILGKVDEGKVNSKKKGEKEDDSKINEVLSDAPRGEGEEEEV